MTSLEGDLRSIGVTMHGINERLDVPPLSFGPTDAAVTIPRIPLVLLALQFVRIYA